MAPVALGLAAKPEPDSGDEADELFGDELTDVSRREGDALRRRVGTRSRRAARFCGGSNAGAMCYSDMEGKGR